MDVLKDLLVDKPSAHIRWAGSPIALHSHHYHFQLQNTLRLTDYIDGGALTRDSAALAVSTLLRQRFGASPAAPAEVLSFASLLFAAMGFGKLEVPGPHDASAPTNMYVDGWAPHWGYSKQKQSPCDFPAGFIAGAVQAAYGQDLAVTESACRATGAQRCTFTITEVPRRDPPPPPYNTTPGQIGGPSLDAPPVGGAAVPHSIDEAAIVDAVLSLPLFGDSERGLSERFGVMINWTPQQFYSCLEFGFITRLAEYHVGLERSAEQLLHFDGEACALNTFDGITHSPEWKGLIAPMLRAPGDQVVALAAVMNCLGWGRAQIVELEAGRRVEVRLFGGQEGLGYRSLHGLSDKPRCYAFSGAVRALMEVFLPGDVIEAKFGRFRVDETQCVSMGAPHCRFVAEQVS